MIWDTIAFYKWWVSNHKAPGAVFGTNNFIIYKMRNILILACVLTVFGCGEEEVIIERLPEASSEITIRSSSSLQIDRLSSDQFSIVSATPYPDHFEIIVEYGGGCEEHHFELLWDQSIAESFPMQTWMTLVKYKKEGLICDALVYDTLNIDYALIENYDPEDMIVHLANGSNNQMITLDSRATSLITEDCTLEVDMQRAICGYGIWGDLYFKLPEGIGAWEQVWLQPLMGTEEMHLMNPAEASGLKVQVKPIFGYQWESDLANCQAIPEGLIIPVEVLCMD